VLRVSHPTRDRERHFALPTQVGANASRLRAPVPYPSTMSRFGALLGFTGAFIGMLIGGALWQESLGE